MKTNQVKGTTAITLAMHIFTVYKLLFIALIKIEKLMVRVLPPSRRTRL